MSDDKNMPDGALDGPLDRGEERERVKQLLADLPAADRQALLAELTITSLVAKNAPRAATCAR